MNTALNERELTAVSGGTDTGKIGPRNPEIRKAKQLVQDSLTLLDKQEPREPALEADMKSALAFLKQQSFKPYDAYVYLDRAIGKAQEIRSRRFFPQRIILILDNLNAASRILRRILF